MAALCGLNGDVVIFNIEKPKVVKILLDENLVNGKIFSLIWLTAASFLTCGPQGRLQIWQLAESDTGDDQKLKEIYSAELPPSRERWPTSAVLFKSLLICGDRAGSIVTYKTSVKQDGKPNQIFRSLHGRNGVTCISLYKANGILSTGRDGMLHQFAVQDDELVLLQTTKLPMHWVAKVMELSGMTVILGFQEVSFVVWNLTEQRTVMKTWCGGGHRSWDFCVTPDDTIIFVFIRDQRINELSCPLNELLLAALQPGIHYKETNALVSLNELNQKVQQRPVFMSGSEDTTVRVLEVDGNQVNTLNILRSHISSVRTIAVCPTQHMSEKYVFTAGGRALLIAWRVKIGDDKDTELSSQETICTQLTSYFLRSQDKLHKKPWIKQEFTLDSECRYMDLSALALKRTDKREVVVVAAACSDGLMRLFSFEPEERKLTLLGAFKSHFCCQLKVAIWEYCSHLIVATMGTDGHLVLWNVTDILKIFDSDAGGDFNTEELLRTSAAKVQPFFKLEIHISGINSFDYKRISPELLVLATGGDDTALSLLVLEMSTSEDLSTVTVKVIDKWSLQTAHFSQITGLKLTNSYILTAAIDYRVALWKWKFDVKSKSIQVEYIARYISCVPDMKGLSIWWKGKSLMVCVYGKGLEVLQVDDLTEE